MEFDWVWVWVSLAVILSVAEIFTGGFFLLPFGIGAAVAALIQFFWGPSSIGWQWAAFVGVSSVLLVTMRRFADHITDNDVPQSMAANRLLGKTGVLLGAIEPPECQGLVRVDREEWRAESPGCSVLMPGTQVEVIGVEGAHLVVRPLSEASATDA
ncbi:MAG: NfeD family protein [Coriobacteriia bacterium]|nr:NfeD family protein [Coriobacteriia bacterium]